MLNLLSAVLVLAIGGTVFSAPLINDITTTYPHPPEFIEISKIEASRNYAYNDSFADIQRKAYSLGPYPSPKSPSETFKQVEQAAKKMGWKIISSNPAAMHLEAVDTTRLLRFKDDICIEVRTTSDGQMLTTPAAAATTTTTPTSPQTPVLSWVHMRSKSRTGRGDFGKNAARIKDFFTTLAKEK